MQRTVTRKNRARARETLRRRGLLNALHNSTSHLALYRAQETMQWFMDEAFECIVPRNAPLEDREEALTNDMTCIAEMGTSGRGQTASFHAMNATAGLGKSRTFLHTLAERVAHCDEELTAVIISPTHDLSEQSYKAFCKAMRECGADPDGVARQFVAVDAACKHTCSEATGPNKMRPFKQRKLVADAGGKPETFCHPSSATHPGTDIPINRGCPLRGICGYWQQLVDKEDVRVWFITHAAAQKGSLRAAGIHIKFDLRYIDEDCLNLYIEEEEIDLMKLPRREEETSFTHEIIDKFGRNIVGAINTAELRRLAERFAMTAILDGEEIRDGKTDKVDINKLKYMRHCLDELLIAHLRPKSGQAGFDPASAAPRDAKAEEGKTAFSLQHLKNMRQEARLGIAVIDLLLGYCDDAPEYPALGYTPIRNDGRPGTRIKIMRRGGFNDRSVDVYGEGRRAADFVDVHLEYEEWLAPFVDSGEMPEFEPPAYQFLGSTMIYTDATLTPEVVEATMYKDPDMVPGVVRSMQYNLVPHDGSLVRWHWMSQAKGSRKRFGCGNVNKRIKDEETGEWHLPDVLTDDDQKAIRNIQSVNAQIERLARAGKRVLVICPKAISPEEEKSRDRIVTLRKFEDEAPGMVDFMTWGNVAGKNGFEEVDALIIVSEAVPAPRDVENMAIALTGKPVPRIGQHFESCDLVSYAKNDETGRYTPSSRPVHPHALCEAIRWTQMEGQVMQAIARARGVRRGRPMYEFDEDSEELVEIAEAKDLPLDVHLFNRLILDYEPDKEIGRLSSLMPSEFELLEREGLFIENLKGHGARRVYGAMMGGRAPKTTWTECLRAEGRRRASNGGTGPEWPKAVAMMAEDEGRALKVHVRVRPGSEEAIIKKGVHLVFDPEDQIDAILEALVGEWTPVGGVKEVIAELCGQSLSTQKVKKLLGELVEFNRTNTGWECRPVERRV